MPMQKKVQRYVPDVCIWTSGLCLKYMVAREATPVMQLTSKIPPGKRDKAMLCKAELRSNCFVADCATVLLVFVQL